MGVIPETLSYHSINFGSDSNFAHLQNIGEIEYQNIWVCNLRVMGTFWMGHRTGCPKVGFVQKRGTAIHGSPKLSDS